MLVLHWRDSHIPYRTCRVAFRTGVPVCWEACRSVKLAFLVAVACLISFWVGYALRPSDPPPNLAEVSNDEYLDVLGTAVEVLPGCAVFLGNADNMKTVLFVGDGTNNNRLTAVCVPR